MPADHGLHVELERLADVAHHEIEASAGSVADGFSQEAREACAAITARLIAAGVDRTIAEWATTIWICGGYKYEGSVWACKEKADYYAELGLITPAGGA
jgi:hypothetical protein